MKQFLLRVLQSVSLVALFAAPVALAAAPKITDIQIIDDSGNMLADETFSEGEVVNFEVTFDQPLNTQATELKNFKLQLNYPRTGVDSAEYAGAYAADGEPVGGVPNKLRFHYTVRAGDIVPNVCVTGTSGTLSFLGLASQVPEFDGASYSDRTQNISLNGWSFTMPSGKIPVCVTTLLFRTEGNLPGKTANAKPRVIRLISSNANAQILDGEVVDATTSLITVPGNGVAGDLAVRVAFYSAGAYTFQMKDERSAEDALIQLGTVNVKATTFTGDDGVSYDLFSQDAWNYFTLTVKNGEDNKVPRGDTVDATLTCYLPDSYFAANGPLALDLAFANASVSHSPKSDVVFTHYGQALAIKLTGSRNATQVENVVGLVPSGITGVNFAQQSGIPPSNLYILPQVLVASGDVIYGELTVGSVLKELELLYNGNPIGSEGLYYNEGEILTNLVVQIPAPAASPISFSVSTLNKGGVVSTNVLQASPATITIAAGQTNSTPFNVLVANGDAVGTIRITQKSVPVTFKQLDVPVNACNVDPEATLTAPLQSDFSPLQKIQFRATFKDVLADKIYCYIDYGDGTFEKKTLIGRRDPTGAINGLAPWATFALAANHAYTQGGKTYQWVIYYTDTFTTWNDYVSWPTLTGAAVISAPRFLHVIKVGSGDGTVSAVTAGDATSADILDGTSKVSKRDDRTLLFPFAADASNVVNSCVLSAFPYNGADFTFSGRTEAQRESSSDKASYFCAWLWPAEFQVSGDEAGRVTAYDNPNSVTVTFPEAQGQNGKYPDVTLYALFSGEYIDGDGVGDYDADGMPDFWEKKYWDVTPNATIDALFKEGNASANDDDDRFPEAGVAWLWPNERNGERFSFAPTGLPFNNLIEARGVEPDQEKVGEFAIVIPEAPWAESTYLPGTDPTKADTSGDGYSDAWKYYFWNIATNDPKANEYFKAYDPSWVQPGGIPIDPAAVAEDFLPTGMLSHNADHDGDGLSDWEEYQLGTNPLHFDTDGDGINDGYEVRVSADNPGLLNPLVSDSDGNPDGDAMARFTTTISLTKPELNGFMPLVTHPDFPDELFFVYAEDNGLTYKVDLFGVVIELADGEPLPPNSIVFRAFRYGVYEDSQWIVAKGIVDPAETPYDGFVAMGESKKSAIIHDMVAEAFGFDPRTGWALNAEQVLNPDGSIAGNVNTAPYTTLDEYLLFQYLTGGAGGMNIPPTELGGLRTHPGKADTDDDQVPDGWELYTGYNPGFGEDARYQSDPILTVAEEFASMQSSAVYGFVNPNAERGWVNKLWPTDPRDPRYYPEANDTDGDGLPDGVEGELFIHPQGATDAAHRDYEKLMADVLNVYDVETSALLRKRSEYSLIVYGGGLNPCSIDTDGDLIPDNYEAAQAMAYSTDRKDWVDELVGTGCYGMDGTIDDGMADYDHDGLLNYQEYMVGAMRHFRYDVKEAEIPLKPRNAEALGLFTTAKSWDTCGVAGYYLKDTYASTDVFNPDSDMDGMDDYYEMFHGLNPILGTQDLISERSGLDWPAGSQIPMTYKNNSFWDAESTDPLMDFKKYPWVVGLPTADPDMDGIVNADEAINPNGYASHNYHSDPTPAWMTDPFYADSFVNLYYSQTAFDRSFIGFPQTPNYWIRAAGTPAGHPEDKSYIYSFEVNEGFDTDGSGLSDKEKVANGLDPIDHYANGRPRRQAMWFNGEDAALATPLSLPLVPTTSSIFTYRDVAQSLRNYTVELWVRPENVSTEQVIIERPCVYPPSNEPHGNESRVRYTFRLGIQKGGALFAEFDGAGESAATTEKLVAGSINLNPDEWVHVAAVVNGYNKRFELYVNGKLVAHKNTIVIPANGVYGSTLIPDQQVDRPTDAGESLGTAADGEEITVPSQSAEQIKAPLIIGGSTGRDAFTVSYTDGLGRQVTENIYGRVVKQNFFKGYVDQVRIWNGARTPDEIAANYTKRFTREDALANRDQVALAARKALMENQQTALELELPAALYYHYSFDNFFSTGMDATGAIKDDAPVLVAPKGWASTQTPDDYLPTPLAASPNTLFPLLYGVPTPTGPSTVYTTRQYVPMAQNMIGHLPLRGEVTADGVNNNDEVLDSRFWAVTHAGVNSNGVNRFPNVANPYGIWWVHDNHPSVTTVLSPRAIASLPRTGSELPGLNLTGDLIPLGGAWTKPVPESWDGAGPVGGSWSALSQDDSNGNGLPDWFIAQKGGDPLETDRKADSYIGWTKIDPATGLTYGQGFLEALAQGDTTDSDGDGLPDWWETYFGLDPNDPEGDNGPYGDPDGDGLNNYAEYLAYLRPTIYSTFEDDIPDAQHYLDVISFTYGMLLSDNDFVEDLFEAGYNTRFANPWASDGTRDHDNDGWDLWSEARYVRGYKHSTNPTVGIDASGIQAPIPAIELSVSFAATREIALSNATLVVWGYSGNNARDQQHAPNAVWTVPLGTTVSNTFSIGQVRVGEAVAGILAPGNLLPGTVNFTTKEMREVVENGETTLSEVDVIVATDNGKGQLVRLDNNEVVGQVDYARGRYANLNLSFLPEGTAVDVTYEASTPVSASAPFTVLLETPDRGQLDQGTNSFFIFLDEDGDGLWTWEEDVFEGVRELAGIPAPSGRGGWASSNRLAPTDFTHQIGWDMTKLAVTLTERATGFLRLSWNGLDISSSSNITEDAIWELRAYRLEGTNNISDQPYFVKRFPKAKTFIHEGDFYTYGQFGMECQTGFVNPPSFRTNVSYLVLINDVTNGVYNMNYPLGKSITGSVIPQDQPERIKPTALAPINGERVMSSCPTFRWQAYDGATAFRLTIRRGNSLVYDSNYQNMPQIVKCDTAGNGSGIPRYTYEWSAPLAFGLANQGSLPDGEYSWTVTHYAPWAQSGGSSYQATGKFQIVAEEYYNSATVVGRTYSTKFGFLDLNVRYAPLKGTTVTPTTMLRVEAFDKADFVGVPVSGATVAGMRSAIFNGLTYTNGVEATVLGLEAGKSYYVMAYLDLNSNGIRDVGEPWGYVRRLGKATWQYDPVAVEAQFLTKKPVELWIQDVDTDNDGLPDTYELVTNKDLTVQNYGLMTADRSRIVSAVLAYSAKGLKALTRSDMAIPAVQLALLGSVPGEAIATGTAVMTPAVVVDGFSVAEDGTPTIKWRFGNQSTLKMATNEAQPTAKAITPIDTVVKYVLERKTSLMDAEWKVVAEALSITGLNETKIPTDAPEAFFRVRVVEYVK